MDADGKPVVLVTFGKQELSLMQKLLSTGSFKQMVRRMCDFMDEEEALDYILYAYKRSKRPPLTIGGDK